MSTTFEEPQVFAPHGPLEQINGVEIRLLDIPAQWLWSAWTPQTDATWARHTTVVPEPRYLDVFGGARWYPVGRNARGEIVYGPAESGS